MNLIIPINLKALRVTPNDASLITKATEYFSGPMTSYDSLPWRNADYSEISGRSSMANVSANVNNPLSGNVAEQLNAGIHLHWALPDGLSRGVQEENGALEFPAVPNRWLITRIMNLDKRFLVKQWIVESDYLMTEEEYTQSYHPQSGRKCITIPVGWDVLAGHDPEKDGGALYYPPFRRMGRVFELSAWQPAESQSEADLTKINHLDEFILTARNFTAPGKSLGPLKAVGAGGPSFAAYYPDSGSIFGFHDNFNDMAAGLDLGGAEFQVSYQVTGWHGKIALDPLQADKFKKAYNDKVQINDNKNDTDKLDPEKLLAQVIRDTYGWYYDPSAGEPARCLYGGQLSGLPWDTTGDSPQIPGKKTGFPKCYLAPDVQEDESVRIAVGNSASSALAALLKEEWKDWAGSAWNPDEGKAPDIPEEIEQNLEYLLDALQLGILHRLGKSYSLPQLEQALHRNAFGSRQGGVLWIIRKKSPADDHVEPSSLSDDSGGLSQKLDALNKLQRQLDGLLNVIESCRRRIFLDWYKYITTVFPVDQAVLNKEELTGYISEELLDLWAKLEAAFGKQTGACAGTNNIPVFYSNEQNYIAFDKNSGIYQSNSPAPSLAGQIVAAANGILSLLAADHPLFELQQSNSMRYWEPNEPVIVAAGDSLEPAVRNGTVKYLPCRLSGQMINKLGIDAPNIHSAVQGPDIVSSLAIAVPNPADKTAPDYQAVFPLLDDIQGLLAEACLLDPLLAELFNAKLNTGADPAITADIESALENFTVLIRQTWQQGVPDKASPPVPGILKDQTVTANNMKAVWYGQAPQGLALAFQNKAGWEDPFLPLFLVWTAEYTPFKKGTGAGSDTYDQFYLADRFKLDENYLELVFNTPPPVPEAGAVTFSGSIVLSSRAAQPLYQGIQDYLSNFPDENPDLKKAIDHLKNKPLLSQGLDGTNTAMRTLAKGLQLTPFNPFYDRESIPKKLVASSDNFQYNNSLTFFAGYGAGPYTDQMPGGETLSYNLLQAGYLNIKRADIVDVFGRKRTIINPDIPADREKIIPSWQLKPDAGNFPAGVRYQMYLPPRLAQPSRLLFRWLSADSGEMEMSSHASTSPVCAWIVPNHLDNSLMLFNGSGSPLGSLGVFGSQQKVNWQSPAGNPARTMEEDLTGANPELEKVAVFIYGKDREFFQELMDSIENAHTYILPEDKSSDQAQIVFMGRPLALLRAGLRLELMGLPAFDTSNASLSKTLSSESDKTYDWTKRACADILNVDFPVRLGDRNHLEDGLVAYFIDGPEPYQAIYAPAAATSGIAGVVRPAPNTLTVKLNADLDPPVTPYTGAADQVAHLQQCKNLPEQTVVTLLIDPRARVHASMGVLPVKAVDLPSDVYAAALKAIEVTFFTHPVLRGSNGLQLPLPEESGFLWNWITGVVKDGREQPVNEELTDNKTGDRAHFSYSPQVAQDGWLKLKPQPPQSK